MTHRPTPHPRQWQIDSDRREEVARFRAIEAAFGTGSSPTSEPAERTITAPPVDPAPTGTDREDDDDHEEHPVS